MADLNLFDTLSRSEMPLLPSDGKTLRFYCCGPTVYGPGHIGNFRTFILNDVLYRTAKLAGLHPYYVRNLTDLDDKTIRDSQKAGKGLRQFTDHWIEIFHEDCRKLNMLPPDREPRATEHIQEQIALIQALEDKGYAYQGSDGSVYFRVDSYEGYGKLSHFDPKSLQSQNTNSGGEPNLADEYDREQVADFALWKAHKEADGENAWPSPWGKGRPGWHLECSAMSMRYLGQTFDLHTGGEDLCFPHHENEIAQSEGATGHPFAHHWMHVVFLLVDGKKMSKSLGNFYTVGDLLEKGYSPMAIRYVLISGHYRKQLNFTEHSLESAQSALDKLAETGVATEEPDFSQPPALGIFQDAWNHLLDDLNTPAALGSIFSALKQWDDSNPEHRQGLKQILYALGLELNPPESKKAESIPEIIASLARERWQAKQAKDFSKADQLRDEIQAQGWKILDRKDGYDLEKI